MNERTCIVSRESCNADDLLRFVAAPDGSVVADLNRKLPGRGVWVRASREFVDKAARKNLFARGLKKNVSVSSTLADEVDQMLERSALAGLGLARKAGQCVTGAGKVDEVLRAGKVVVLLHAQDAAADGVRKLTGAACVSAGKGRIVRVFNLFDSRQMSLALGGSNVVHAALTNGGAAKSFLRRAAALVRYRGGSLDTGEQVLPSGNGFQRT